MVRDMHSRRRLLAGTALTGVVLALAGGAAANPVNPTVVHGTVGFDSNGSLLEVRQGSDKAIIDWRGFDIGQGETTRFVQPGAGSIALNRITGGQESRIDGSLTANGRIFLINPNGILFGAGSTVDVGGLVATTADMANDRFIAGDYRFDGASSVAGASVINNGTITAGGMAALVAPYVRNTGTIQAGLGRVTLGAAQRFTLDLAGDGLISFDAGAVVDGARLEQAGLVSGGTVLLSASTAARVVDNVIDMSGIVEARGVRQEGGDIVLDGGQGGIAISGTLDAGAGSIRADANRLDVSGTLHADAAGQGDGGSIILMSQEETRFTGAITARGAGTGQGGFAEVSSRGGLTYRGTADLTADSGVKGTLLLDPKNIIVAAAGADTVAGNDAFAENPAADATIAAADVVAALNGANLVLQANNDITVNAGIDASANAGAGDLTLRAGRSVALNADVAVKGAFTATANDPAAIAANRDPGTGSISVASGVTVNSTGAQTFNGDLSLAGNLVSSGTGAITLAGTLTVADLATIVTAGGAGDGVSIAGASNGTGFLTIDAGSGSVQLGTMGASQALAGLAVKGGTVALNGVRTSGRQDYAGTVTLAGDLVSTAGGAIRLGGPVTLAGNSTIITAGFASDDIQVTGAVNGAYALVADAGAGKVSFGGAVGATNALTLLSAGGSGVTLGSVTTSGRQDYAGTVTLAGDLVSTAGGAIRLGGPVTLAGNSTIVTAGFAGDDIQVTGAVNGAYALVADAGAGKVSFGGAVGATNALTLLSAGGSGVTLGSVTTSGRQDYAGTVTLAGDLVSTAGGAIRLGGPVTLAGNSTIVTAGFASDDIQVTGAVNGAYALVADAGAGKVSFGGAVGATNALTLLSAGGSGVTLGSVTTSGRQDYAGTVTLAGDLVSTAGGAIRLGGPVTLAGNSTIVTAGFASDDIQVTGAVNGAYALVADAGAGKVSFGGPVGATNALTLLSAGGSGVTLGSVTTSGRQDYAGTVTLAGNLVSTAGGAIRLGGPVTLAGNSTIVTAGFAGDDIQVTGAVNGAYALVADAGAGKVSFGGAVGATNALTLLSAAGSSVAVGDVTTTGLQDYAGSVTLAGNLVSISGGDIRLAGPVTLAGNSAIVTAGFAGDDIRVVGAVNGPYALLADAGQGNVTMGGTVGAGQALSLFSAAGTSVTLNDVTTTGAQDYAGTVTLGGNLVSAAGGAIRIAGTTQLARNSAIVTAGFAGDDIRLGAVDGPYSLVLDAGAGRVEATGAVGATQALSSFAAGGASVSLRGVTTRGLQDYAGALTLAGDLVSNLGGSIRIVGPVTLAADSAIVTAGFAGDDIRVAGTVNGPYALVLDAGAGQATLDGAIGGISALKLLSVGGANISLRGVKTTGQQDYAGTVALSGDLSSSAGGSIRVAGPLILATDSTLTTAGAATDAVTVTGAVSGPYRLTVRAGKGNVGFGSTVTGLTGLDVAGGAVDAAGSIGVTTALVANATRLTTGSLSAASITLTGTDALSTGALTASQDVTVTGGKTVTLGNVSARGLTLTGTDAVSTGTLTTTQDVTVTGGKAVTLGNVSTRNLTASAGTSLRLANVTGQGAVLTAGTQIASTGTLTLSGPLVLDTSGTATGLDVRVGSLTYRGTGRFAATGTVGGMAGSDAADLILITGPRSGTYLFADRPVFGVATLVERHRLDIPLVDTVPADETDVRTAPLVLDPAAVKDDLISFND